MIYRKDITLLLLVLMWGAYIFYGLEPTSANNHEIIVNFTASMLVLDVVLIVLMVLMTYVKKFKAWMLTPIFGKEEEK